MSHTCVCHHTTCAAHILNGLRMHRRPGSQAARAAAPRALERRWRILRHSACADCAATHACSCCRHTLRTGCAAVRACCCRRSPCTALAARHQLAANFRQTRADRARILSGKWPFPWLGPGSLLVPGPVHFGLRVPKSSSSVHDLVARSERDGEAGWGENYSPDGMTPRDVHNAATAEHCSAAAVWRWLVGSAGRGGDGRRGLRGDAIMATL